jgi:protein SCO1/2
MNKNIPYILIAVALLLGFFVKDYFDLGGTKTQAAEETADNSNNRIDNQYKTLLIYPKKNPLPNFSMVNQDGIAFNNENFKGKWNLIFSGFTNCPDVCPNTLTQMTQLYQLMNQKTKDKFQIIFLSVDPERDTPEYLKQYLDYFHEDFKGISGKKDQIDLVIKSLGGIYSLNKEEGEFYTVDHSARIFIVGPNSERYGIVDSSAIKEKDKMPLVNDLMALAK